MADHEGKHKSDSEIAVRKIFIGGLSYSTDDEKLRKYFSAYGPVQDAVVMKDPVSRRSRGFGFITFMDIESVDNALENEPHVIDARKVEAKRAVPRSELPRESGAKPAQTGAGSKGVGGGGSNAPLRTSSSSDSAIASSPLPPSGGVLNMSDYAYNKIFVGGLHYDTRDADFKAYFEKYGRIITAEVMFNRETHKSRGFGFIVFELEKSAELVCADKQHFIAGKAVEVKRAVPRSKIGPGLQSPGASAAQSTLGSGFGLKSDSASGSSASSNKAAQPSISSAAAQGKVGVGKAIAGTKGTPTAAASTTASTAPQVQQQQLQSQVKNSGASTGGTSGTTPRAVTSYAAALKAGSSNYFESGSETDSFAAVSLSDLSISARLLMSSAVDPSAPSLLEGDRSIFGGGSLSRTSSLSETIASHEQRLRSYSMELMQDAVKSSSTPPFHGGSGQVSAPTGLGLGIAALNKSSDQEFSRSNSVDGTPVKSAQGVPPLSSALTRHDTISSSRSNSIDWSVQGNKVVGSPLLTSRKDLSPSNANAPGTGSPLSLNWLSPTITPMEGVATMPSLSLDSKEEHSMPDSRPLPAQADPSRGQQYSPPRGSRAQTQGQVQGQYQMHGNPYVQRNGSPPIPFFGVPSPNAWAEMMGAQQGYPPLPAYPGVGGSAQGMYYPQEFFPQGYPPMGSMDPQRPMSGYYPYSAQDEDQRQERNVAPPGAYYGQQMYGQQMFMQYPEMMQQQHQQPGFYTGGVDIPGSDSQEGVFRAHSASIASAGGASGGSAEDLVRGARAWSTGSIASAFSGRGSEGTSRSNEHDLDDISFPKDINPSSIELKLSGTGVSDRSSKAWSSSTQS